MTSRTFAEIDARAALRGMSKVGEATAFGVARGLNDVAFQAMRFERSNMQKRLDRPSRFTLSGTQVERAGNKQAVPEAAVFVEDKRAKYLSAQEEGGTQTRASIGASRGSGSSVLVIPVAQEMQNALGSAGRNAVRRALRLSGTYQTADGFFRRKAGGGAQMLLAFAEQIRLKPRLHFADDVTKFVRPRIGPAVARSVDRAISRAVRS